MSQVLHKFTSTKPDGPDPTLVKPSNWNDQHSITYQIDVISGAASILLTDDVVRLQTGTYAVTVPLATGSGKEIIVCQDGAGTMTLTPSGADTIGGLTSVPLSSTGSSCILVDEAAGIWGLVESTSGSGGVLARLNGMIWPHGWPIDTNGNPLVTLSYNAGTREITITANSGSSFTIWWRGVPTTIASPFTTTAHAATEGGWFLSWNGTAFTWSQTVWDYYAANPTTYVYYSSLLSTGAAFSELHRWGTDPGYHQNIHFAIGTSLQSGGQLSGYTLNTFTNAALQFSVAQTIINDEDINYVLGPAASGSYTVWYRSGVNGYWEWQTGLSFPFIYTAGAYADINTFTGGTWGLTSLAGGGAGSYGTAYVVTTPALLTSNQFIIIPGQTQYTTLAAAQAETFQSLSLGSIPWIEFVAIAQIVFYAHIFGGGTTNTSIASVTALSGSRASVTVSVSSISTLALAYSNGSTSAQQTMSLLDSKGGGIIVNGTEVGFTGASAFQVQGANSSVVNFPTPGGLTVTTGAIAGSTPTALAVTGGAYTTMVTTVEDVDININLSATKTWASGAIAVQRDVLIQSRTYAFSSASTVSTAATLAITDAPAEGANATITNAYALWIMSGITFCAGPVTISPPGAGNPAQAALKVVGGAYTGIPATTEDNDVLFDLSATKTWASGAVATQRDVVVKARTYAFTGASTVTTAATMAVTGAPIAGANATITNPYALWIQSGNTLLNGLLTVSPGVLNAVTPTALTVTGGAYTAMPATVEDNDVNFNLSATKTWATGAIATQRDVLIQARTYAFAGASTMTTAVTLAVTNAPQPGSNCTITNPFAFGIQSGNSFFNGEVGIGYNGTALPTSGGGVMLAVYAPYQDDPSNGATQGNIVLVSTAGGSPCLSIGIDSTGDAWLQSQTTNSAGANPLYLNPNGGCVAINSADSSTQNSRLYVGTSVTASTTSWNGLKVIGTFAYTGSSVTTPSVTASVFSSPALTSTNAWTVTTAATLAIGGPPGAGSNVTITSSYALWVESGNTLLNGLLSVAPSALASITPTALTVTGGAYTAMVTTVEDIDVNLNLSATKTWATGAITTQRDVLIQARTYAFTGASTVTNASTLAITNAPQPGSNATITNPWALWVQAGASVYGGNVLINTTGPASAFIPPSTSLEVVTGTAYAAGNSTYPGAIKITNNNLGGPNVAGTGLEIQAENSDFGSGSGIKLFVDSGQRQGGIAYRGNGATTWTLGLTVGYQNGGVVVGTGGSGPNATTVQLQVGSLGTTITPTTNSVWYNVYFASAILSLSGTATVTELDYMGFGTIRVQGISGSPVITDLFTVKIPAPTAFGTATATRAWALGVAGNALFQGGMSLNGTSLNAAGPYTILATDFKIEVLYTTTAAFTCLLPGISTLGIGRKFLLIVDSGYNAATNNITVTANGSDKINNGAAGGSALINTNGGVMRLSSNPNTSNWELW